MSFSAGVFSINSTGQPVVTGTVISSTVFNAFTSDIATGLSTCVLKDGTQTVTANIPMSNFKFTGLAAGTATGDSLRYGQVNGVVTTLGDTLYATGAGAFARIAAKADVAAHATTSDVWVARQVVLTGSVVTFTDIADAPYVGAVVWVKQNDAHVWTNGATFSIQGAANYTAAAGDWIRIYATTVSTFEITIFKVAGVPSGSVAAQTFLGSDVNLDNASNYFNIVNTGSIGGAGQKWLIAGTLCAFRNAGSSQVLLRIWDGSSTVYVETNGGVDTAGVYSVINVYAIVTLSAATTFHLSAKASATDAVAITTGGSGTANKATSIVAIRLS